MKKLLSMLLVLVLALGIMASAEYYGGYDEMIDATIAVYQRSSQGDAKDIWWWDFCREYFGINFKVTQLTETTTYKSTCFASGDMPDVFYQLFLDSGTLVEQGITNHNLLALDPYITPEIMPNLSKIYDLHPEYKATITAGDGHIYSLGGIGNGNAAAMTFYYNQRWLDEADLEVPTTLDEFRDAMAAFKAREELPQYEGKIIVPLTGDLGNQPRFIANAFGWVTNAAGYLTAIALKDGQPLFIYADEERFPAFMEIMKEFIEAGYFSADVFDDQYAGNQTAAQKAEDLTGFDQNTNSAIDPTEWVAAIPLTSEYNDVHQIPRTTNALNNASFALSGKLEDEAKIERLMTWVDWLYVYDNYKMSHWGPSADETEYLYGLKSGYIASIDPNTGKWVYTSQEVIDGEYTSFGDYQNRRVQGIIDNSYIGLNVDMFNDVTRPVNPPTYTNKVDENVLPYLVDSYPAIIFFDAATNARVSELRAEINSYVNENYVKFISGEKELSEENLAEFFATIKKLGYDEYVGYYVDYYNDVYLAGK